MKIGVVIPAYNAEKYLRACLDSVLSQTVSDLGVYAMDDGSSDRTADILAEYAAKDPRVKCWRQSNRGLVATMNALLDRLDDDVELVSFVDSDDFIHPRMYELMTAELLRTGSDVAECRIVHVAESATVGDVFTTEPPCVSRTIDDMSVYLLKRTAPGQWINKQNKLYRRDAIGSIRFQPTLSYEDDYFFAYEVNAAVRRKVIVDSEFYAYRATPGSATAKIPFREYVRATQERIRLSLELFLAKGRIPSAIEAEWRSELAKDAYRMCIRKNLKKNRDPVSRRELFRSSGVFFRELEGFVLTGLNPIQELIFRCAFRGRYALARFLAYLT